MLLVLYAFICVILAAIFALVTAAAVVLSAFTIYILGGRSVAEHFFLSSLDYIKENGGGLDLEANEKALTVNLKRRLSWALLVTMISATVVALFIFFAVMACMNSGNVFLYVSCIGMFIGLIVGPIYFYEHALDLENGVECIVGKLTELRPDELIAVFVDQNGNKCEFCFIGDKDLYEELIIDRMYYAADFIGLFAIANSNDDEWEDDETD